MLIHYIPVFTSGSNEILRLCNMPVQLTPQYDQVTGQRTISGSDNGVSEVSSLPGWDPELFSQWLPPF